MEKKISEVALVIVSFILGVLALSISLSLSAMDINLDFILNIFTSLGGLATALTFILVIFQYRSDKNLRIKEQKNLKEEREKREELINFEKYQKHQELFDKMLLGLERKYNISFENKFKLYKNIYPDNNFKKTHLKIKEESLEEISSHLRKTKYILKTKREGDFIEMVSMISNIQNFFEFSYNKPPSFGDVKSSPNNSGHIVFNIIDPISYLSKIENIVNEIMHFSEYNHLIQLMGLDMDFKLWLCKEAIDYIESGQEGSARIITHEDKKIENALKILFFYKLSSTEIPYINIENNYKYHHQMINSENINELLTDADELDKALKEILNEIDNALLYNDPMFNVFKKLKADYLNSKPKYIDGIIQNK